MRVALFVTCLVDLMRPRIAFSTLKLLQMAGCEVAVPGSQTCCGQPAFNSGDRDGARRLAQKTIAEFEAFDYVVAPSGSCADHIRNEYPGLFTDVPQWRHRAVQLGMRTYELSDFLVNIVKLERVPGKFSGSVTYHDSCTGLRSLGVKAQPRALLAKMGSVDLKEMADCEDCCGFGGAFSVKFGDISAAIAARKCGNIQAADTDAVVGGDLGCLLNIEGKLRRLGDDKTRVLHIAEILAGED